MVVCTLIEQQELQKMFTDSDSFYYSETFDLTTSLQRQHSEGYQSNKHLPLWQQVDPRFFWNRHMLDELIQADRDPEASTICKNDCFSLVLRKKNCTSLKKIYKLDLLFFIKITENVYNKEIL